MQTEPLSVRPDNGSHFAQYLRDLVRAMKGMTGYFDPKSSSRFLEFCDYVSETEMRIVRATSLETITSNAAIELWKFRRLNDRHNLFEEEGTPMRKDLRWLCGVNSIRKCPILRALMPLSCFEQLLDHAHIRYFCESGALRCAWWRITDLTH